MNEALKLFHLLRWLRTRIHQPPVLIKIKNDIHSSHWETGRAENNVQSIEADLILARKSIRHDNEFQSFPLATASVDANASNHWVLDAVLIRQRINWSLIWIFSAQSGVDLRKFNFNVN